MQMTGDGSQSIEVPVGWPNVQIETARRVFLERHPLARSKLEAAIAKAEGMFWTCKLLSSGCASQCMAEQMRGLVLRGFA